jgi:hypothetical protein
MKSQLIKLASLSELLLVTGLFFLRADATAAGNPAVPPARDCDVILGKPRPECSPPPSAGSTPSSQSADPAPRPLRPGDREKAENVLREGAGRTTPSGRLSAEQIATEVQSAKDRAWISLKGNRQTYVATADGAKGSIFLDDEKYPVRSLALTCDPQDAAYLTEPTYGSRGPDLYPVWIVSVSPGTCTLRNGDFVVTVAVKEPPRGQR